MPACQSTARWAGAPAGNQVGSGAKVLVPPWTGKLGRRVRRHPRARGASQRSQAFQNPLGSQSPPDPVPCFVIFGGPSEPRVKAILSAL